MQSRDASASPPEVGPTGFTSPRVCLDREGGRYRIRMQLPDGEASTCAVSSSRSSPRGSLAYTFEWEEPDPDHQQTMVTLSFLEHSEVTKIVLDQGPFATEGRRTLHETVWTETLDRLEQFLA